MTITAISGVTVGHWTHPAQITGCTVIVLPEPNVAAVEIRGAAPGTRETALLQPGMRVETIQALLLTGGSAFGLAAADGVMKELAAREEQLRQSDMVGSTARPVYKDQAEVIVPFTSKPE